MKVHSNPLVEKGPDVLESKQGGGCLTLFGLPFFAAGVFTMLSALGVIPTQNMPEGWGRVGLFFFSLPFIAVGAGLMFGRKGIIIDRTMGTVLEWYGLLVPMKRKEIPLGSIQTVKIEKRSGDSDSPDTYPVSLEGMGKEQRVEVYAPTDYHEARATAEDLARFLVLNVTDKSTGRKVVRDPDHLDESIRDRAKRTGELVGAATPPSEMKSTVHESFGLVEVEIPETNKIAGYIGCLIPLAFTGFISYKFLDLMDMDITPIAMAGIVGIIAMVLMLFFFIMVSRHKNNHTKIKADGTGIKIEKISGKKIEVHDFRTEEIEEFEYVDAEQMLADADYPGMEDRPQTGYTGGPRMPDGRPAPAWLIKVSKFAPSQGIFVRTDTQTVRFGEGLSKEELQYLHAVMKSALLSKQ